MHEPQALLTIPSSAHHKPLQPQIDRDQLPNHLVVIHDKHPRRLTTNPAHASEVRPPTPTSGPDPHISSRTSPPPPLNPFATHSPELVMFTSPEPL